MIFVVGPGRSGTSTVARLLHENLNVCMGHKFREADEDNQDGYYEDLEFKNLNERFITGEVSLGQWETETRKLVNVRRKTYWHNWGLKDPRLCYLLGLYLSFVDLPTIIRCRRDIELVTKSMQKAYGWTKEESENVYKDRNRRLDNLLQGKKVYDIYFTEHKNEEEVVKWLEKILCQ